MAGEKPGTISARQVVNCNFRSHESKGREKKKKERLRSLNYFLFRKLNFSSSLKYLHNLFYLFGLVLLW